jgi:phage terminase large subunit
VISTIQTTKRQWDWLEASDKRINLLWGGASSAKSHTLAQFLVVMRFAILFHWGLLVVRKTRPAVKASCWELMRDVISRAKIEKHVKPNLSDLRLEFPAHRSFILFDGLDNIAKKKSIVGINCVWAEELTGFTKDTRISVDEWRMLDTICRNQPADGQINQLFATFNPVDPIGNSWVEKMTKRGETKRIGLLHCTHTDNPFLDPAAREVIEANADEDPEYDKIYRKGEWGIPALRIYDNWDTVPKMCEVYDERIWGLDFGYSANPAALLEVRLAGKEAWLQEHIYQTKLTNPELIELIKAKGIITNKNDMIVADRSRPEHIKEFQNAGFNIHPSERKRDDKKEKTSVQFGIDTCRRYWLHCCQASVNLIREISTYKWKPDPEGNPLGEPLKFGDHLMDAMRYAIAKVERHYKAGVGFAPDAPKKQLQPDYDPIEDDDLWTQW